MPVGRFVLDVHGESRSTWPASDNVCAALQIINHLQDCVLDYRNLDRVYIPLDALAAAGAERRGAARAARDARNCSPACTALPSAPAPCWRPAAICPGRSRTAGSRSRSPAIVTLARHFVRLLRTRDPLSENVRLGKLGVAAVGALGAAKGLFDRLVRAPGAVSRSPADERRDRAN